MTENSLCGTKVYLSLDSAVYRLIFEQPIYHIPSIQHPPLITPPPTTRSVYDDQQSISFKDNFFD